ncbi:MAG: DUF1722 domain-containing protein [Candidatus Zixiibacteriota bacterium]|nr:MAG: DUF1722 domain-containing protein [candidate division Zixibacteria bacterium]
MEKPLRLGISTCLLGEKVRYDGGHKYDPFLVEMLGPYVEYVPVCPEVEMGLPTPRESMRLEGDPAAPRLVAPRSGTDHTTGMLAWARRRVRELEKEDLTGFVFKSKSPSSGMERIKVYGAGGMPRKVGVGLFARAFMEYFPGLPVEDDGRLHDSAIRENFIVRLFTYRRWQDLTAEPLTAGRLVDFHARHKLLLLSHSPDDYRIMGKLVARAGDMPLPELRDLYLEQLMTALRRQATPRKHANVLHHLLGYFKKQLAAGEKQEMLEVIEHYRAGHVPLIVPVTLINHYVRKYDQPYLREQVYLNPHPVELRLRNHV